MIKQVFVIPRSDWYYAKNGVKITQQSRCGDQAHIDTIVIIDENTNTRVTVDKGHCIVYEDIKEV